MVSLVHDPIYIIDPEIIKCFKNYDFILSGHMHNGVVPPVLDELWKNNLGIVSPNKKLIINNARGIIPIKLKEKTIYLIISGGIVKIQESSPKILHFFDSLFPMSIENITITNDEEYKIYKIKSRYSR